MFRVTCGLISLLAVLFSVNSFASNSKPEIDFLFVIDNSGSMSSSQDHLAQEMPLFINNLLKKNINYRAAVTTTDAFTSIFKNDPQFSVFKDGNKAEGPSGTMIVTNKTPNAAEVLMKNLRQGILGSGDERAFSSLQASLENPLNSQFRRNDAHLAIIILSDEDDSTHNSFNLEEDYGHLAPVSETIEFLDQYTHSTPIYRLYTVSAFAVFDQQCKNALANSSQKIGNRYAELVDASRGSKVSLCSNFNVGLEEVLQTTLNNMNH